MVNFTEVPILGRVRLQSCAMGTSQRWSHDVDPMWWWVTLPETESPALEFSGTTLVSERVVALWSRGFLDDKWPGCVSSTKAATTYIYPLMTRGAKLSNGIVSPTPTMVAVFLEVPPALLQRPMGCERRRSFATERFAIKKYVHIATTSNMLLAVSTPLCPCREAKNHSTCSPETNGYKLEQNPIAIGYSGIWFRTWDGKTHAPPGIYKTS